MAIVIAGSGALGLYYGARLAASDVDVRFLARGQNLAVLRDHGLTLRSVDGDLDLGPQRASDNLADLLPGANLVMVAVKAFATREIADLLVRHQWEGNVLSLQNGVGNEELLARSLPHAAILGGIAFIGSERTAPGVVNHTAAGHVILGAFQKRAEQAALHWHEKLLEAGVRSTLSLNIRYELWRKLLWNIAFNTTTTLTGTLASSLLETVEGDKLVRELMAEAIRIAAAEGVEIERSEIDRYIDVTRSMGPVRTSMLVDRENGHHLEWQALCADVVGRGRHLGIPTPRAQTVAALLEIVDRGQP